MNNCSHPESSNIGDGIGDMKVARSIGVEDWLTTTESQEALFRAGR